MLLGRPGLVWEEAVQMPQAAALATGTEAASGRAFPPPPHPWEYLGPQAWVPTSSAFPMFIPAAEAKVCARKAYPLDRRRPHRQEELCARWVCFLATSQGGVGFLQGALSGRVGLNFPAETTLVEDTSWGLGVSLPWLSSF